jgi:hypothetical protein
MGAELQHSICGLQHTFLWAAADAGVHLSVLAQAKDYSLTSLGLTSVVLSCRQYCRLIKPAFQQN